MVIWEKRDDLRRVVIWERGDDLGRVVIWGRKVIWGK